MNQLQAVRAQGGSTHKGPPVHRPQRSLVRQVRLALLPANQLHQAGLPLRGMEGHARGLVHHQTACKARGVCSVGSGRQRRRRQHWASRPAKGVVHAHALQSLSRSNWLYKQGRQAPCLQDPAHAHLAAA